MKPTRYRNGEIVIKERMEDEPWYYSLYQRLLEISTGLCMDEPDLATDIDAIVKKANGQDKYPDQEQLLRWATLHAEINSNILARHAVAGVMPDLNPVGSAPECWKGRYIVFRFEPPDPKKKTSTWTVLALGGESIGQVKWFARWRKYCFFPSGETVFEEVCLAEIAQFIRDRTKEHKEGI